MKQFLYRFFAILGVIASFAGTVHAVPSNKVQYNPKIKAVQGNQPLNESYTITITTPNTIAEGSNVTVGFNVAVLSKPAAVDDATALTFITITPATFTVTGPSQTQVVTVSVVVPPGNYAGDYSYLVTTTGWPSGLTVPDAGSTVNARVTPTNAVDLSPPTVTLQDPSNGQALTYYPAVGPLTVPIAFEAVVGDNGATIDSMKAKIGDTLITSLQMTGLNTLDATATGTATITAPGTYTISVEATNINGTGYDSADITVVVSAPPPSLTVSSPTAGATFTYPAGGTTASVPVSVTATSVYGNVTQLTATLDGTPIALNASGPGTTVTASASLSLAAGDYTLVFSAASDYGTAVPVSVSIKVRAQTPPPVLPVVSIATPVANQVFTRTEGDPATVVNYSFTVNSAASAVSAVAVAIDGVAQAPALSGLGTVSVSGTGSVSYTAGGPHTLTVTATNADGSASASTTYTIQQAAAPVCRNLIWLPPVSLNQVVEGGSVVPIKFTLTCHGDFVRDTSVLIGIYEIYADGSFSDPVVYPYGATGNPNPPDYAINGHHYQLNFDTAEGAHRYRVEVYVPLADGSFQVLGTKELVTKGKSRDGRDDERDCDKDRKSDQDRDHDRKDGKDRDDSRGRR